MMIHVRSYAKVLFVKVLFCHTFSVTCSCFSSAIGVEEEISVEYTSLTGENAVVSCRTLPRKMRWRPVLLKTINKQNAASEAC